MLMVALTDWHNAFSVLSLISHMQQHSAFPFMLSTTAKLVLFTNSCDCCSVLSTFCRAPENAQKVRVVCLILTDVIEPA